MLVSYSLYHDLLHLLETVILLPKNIGDFAVLSNNKFLPVAESTSLLLDHMYYSCPNLVTHLFVI